MSCRRFLSALASISVLAGCAMATPPNNSTAEGRVYYACDFAVVERVMDLDGVFDQIQTRERRRWECIRAGGPVAAVQPAPVVTLTPTVPEAAAPSGSTLLPAPEPTPDIGSISRPTTRQPRARTAAESAAPTSIVPPPPLPSN